MAITDYPVVANFKTWVGISGVGDDTLITDWLLPAAQDFVEKYCNRVFKSASATRYFPVVPPFVDAKRRTLWFYSEVTSLTTVTNGDGVVISSADYSLRPHVAPYHRIDLNSNAGYWWTDGGTGDDIAIVGHWGYSTVPPAVVFDAILQIAEHLYIARQSGGGGSVFTASHQTGAIVLAASLPKDVIEMLDPYRRRSV